MPTYTSTIQTGASGTYPTYATLQQWYDDIQGVIGGGTSLVAADAPIVAKVIGNISGAGSLLDTRSKVYTTDATRGILLTSNTPENYSGGLRYDTANGPSIVSTGGFALGLFQTDFTVSNLQIQGFSVGVYLANTNVNVENCVISSAGDGVSLYENGATGGSGHLRNTLIYATGTNALISAVTSNTHIIQNCTLVIPSDSSAIGQFLYIPGTNAFTNCAMFFGGLSVNFLSGGGTPVFTNCATDFVSPPSGTSWLSGRTYANQFNAITIAGGLDFKQKIGADLYGAGVTISGITTDIAGTTRKSPPDVGAWEIGGGAGWAVPANWYQQFGPILAR